MKAKLKTVLQNGPKSKDRKKIGFSQLHLELSREFQVI